MNLYILEVCPHCEFWTLNKKDHRENGPAVIYGNGNLFYYLNNGRNYSKSECNAELIKRGLRVI